MRILIIGGGIMGLAIAIELRLRGASVTILSRDFKQAATHAAAGMLAPQAEGIAPGPMLDLCLHSRSLYPEWIAKLEALSGIDTGYWRCGILAPVDREQAKSQNFTPHSLLDSNWLDREEVHRFQPGLGADVIGGWWYPEDAQVDNRALAQALSIAARELGVDVREGVAVAEIDRHHGTVKSVKTSAGAYQADRYVLATGAWLQQLLPVPVYPLKGQMLSVKVRLPDRKKEASSLPFQGVNPKSKIQNSKSSDLQNLPLLPAQLPLQRVLFGRESYIVPRQDGRIIIGATSENVGFTPENTPAGIQALLARAIRLYPQLQDFPIQEFWWGFRPATPDEMPILGESAWENLTLATGHYRNGILLAPATALSIADLILQQQSSPLLAHFHYSRFDRLK